MPTVLIPVEYAPEKSQDVEFDDDVLRRVTTDPILHLKLEEILRWNCRVPDAWRYTIKVCEGKVQTPFVKAPGRHLQDSNYRDVYANYAIGKRIILLILESPHIHEYKWNEDALEPIGPAQGMDVRQAGGAIEIFGPKVFSKFIAKLQLPDGDYEVVMSNPVPYHTSLSLLKSKLCGIPLQRVGIDKVVRDYVWRRLWAQGSIRNHFLWQCQQYRPVAIFNFRTASLKNEVTKFLWTNGLTMLCTGTHPANTWFMGNGEIAVTHIKMCES